jgi:photosystem II stability/assembly factor-like uncharacterized protein
VVAGAGPEFAVFKSTDRGRSWVRSDVGMPRESRINAFGSLDQVLFAGTDAGLFISRDEARSWEPTTRVAISGGRVISLATLGQRVFAATAGTGLLVSSDKGRSWDPNGATPSKKIRCLLAHEGNLYAGTDAEGAFSSGDGGRVWVPLREGLPLHAQVLALAVVQGRLFAGLYSRGLYAWEDPVRRWKKLEPVTPLALTAVRGTLVAGHNPGGIYWSGDLGASWSKGTPSAASRSSFVLSTAPGELSADAPIWELASDDELVFAGASAGIYYSEDRGHTWTRARTGLPDESPGVAFLVKRPFVLAGIWIRGAKGNPAGAED